MNEERLLERIRTWESEPDRRDRGDNIRQVDSILAHLRRILNTRQGGVPISDTYGIPDLNDFLASYPESVTGVEKSIRQAVEKYEPRLQSVNVTFLPQEEDVLCLRFQITARINADSGRNILIETIVNSDGRISLKK
ncbi:MAG: type VI secretion system baseplate subunit TssE [Deltaproteobacteria bacterium HGW-Deltaproteobacteria-9]|jgi:type VI secretion system protein|nr:MAG: type VI secretion system baseplate subunit TssE [Deltaproteobacteria bacterium HGW-Deltaproteobacteria-9]